jgi:outer membrane protein assembly factor BamB
MNPQEILLLGLKQTVVAICRADGSVLWSTKLEDGSKNAFITLASDERHVFATCYGVLHCLDLQTGSVLWKNSLKGYGYGIASLCLPGQTSLLQAGAAAQIAAEEAAASASTAAVVTT